MAADYHYVSTWQLQAPIERVWAAISDLDQLPAWYPAVKEVQTLAPGDDQRVGARVTCSMVMLGDRLPVSVILYAGCWVRLTCWLPSAHRVDLAIWGIRVAVESDPAAVRRPRRSAIFWPVVEGQLPHPRAIRPHRVDLEVSVARALEGDPAAVR
jgi:polyketide cyclase/dehydrase/lipid transport protein